MASDNAAAIADVDVLQKELAALPDVRAVRVVTGSSGRLTEVHVVSDGDRSPKQIVRDVQTLAAASFDVEIDHRIVSVVNLGRDAVPTPVPRLSIVTVSWTTDDNGATCRVAVSDGTETHHGEASGSATARSRLAAQATVEALRELVPGPRFDLSEVTAVPLGGRRVALVMLVGFAGDTEEVLLGAALVRADDAEATARAVLDGFNRRRPG